MEYLKKAAKSATTGEQDVRSTVQGILDAIEAGGEDVVRVPQMCDWLNTSHKRTLT